MDAEQFREMYAGQAPWDIPGPQPALVAIEEAGKIGVAVLDAGCGTGENALFLASRGHKVLGLDYVAEAIERARAKAALRAIDAEFQEGNALRLDQLGRTFDTVIDCGLFHTFDDEERSRYVAGLATVLKAGGTLHFLCFSDEEPPGDGPRRITRQEIHDSFRDGWQVERIEPSRFDTVIAEGGPRFSPGGPKAWLATVKKV